MQKNKFLLTNIIIGFVFTLLFPFVGLGQQQAHHNDDGPHQKNPGFEAVVSGTIIKNPEEGHTNSATEIHLTYWTSHYWAFGLGYTFIFEDEGRIGHEITPLISHKPWPILTINAGPSFALPNSEHDLEVAGYLEGEINIRIGEKGCHLGPVVGTLIGNEFRYFGGIHIGYEF
ncbi:MAG: hypothetical protein AAF378_00485 [Cyanobacteria bacterium P01_A01_bin.84]